MLFPFLRLTQNQRNDNLQYTTEKVILQENYHKKTKKIQGEKMILQTLSGPVTVSAAPLADDVTQINSLANPPLVPLTEKDVYVRRCRLAGDAMDGQYGCFRTHDLEKLLRLTQGAPALIGHNKFSLAVARFFGGAIETYKGNQYIVPKFYWPKQHSEAEDFRVLLDAGIINEASIAFTFEQPTCSICAKDIRECEHQPEGLERDRA